VIGDSFISFWDGNIRSIFQTLIRSLALASLNAATFVIWSLVAQATWTTGTYLKTEAQLSQVEVGCFLLKNIL